MTDHAKAHSRWRSGLTAVRTVAVACLLTMPVLACGGGGDKNVAPDQPAHVRLLLDEPVRDLPAGTSLVIPGGGLVNNGFPAVSADGSQIAILHLAGDPMRESYPTLDIYSAANLKLQERVDLFPEYAQLIEQGQEPNLRDDRLLARIEATVDEINERLRRDGFRAIPQWYDHEKHPPGEPVDQFGRRLSFVWKEEGNDQTPAVEITSADTGTVEYRLVLPTIEVSTDPENLHNDCVVGSTITQAWFEPQQRILVVRMILAGSWDGCHLPDRWLLERL